MSRNPEGVARAIRAARKIAVCCHVNPDGDTLGCATAMGLALRSMEKEVTLFCDGKTPDQLMFLPGAEGIRAPGEAEGPFDLMLSVDVSDPARLGACQKLLSVSAHTAQIDHHGSNPLFMEVNSVDATAPAACVLVREQLKTLGVPLTREIACCLYTGISTDTGNFAFASTNAETFQVMSELAETGFPLAQLNRILFRDRPRPQVLLLGRALNSLCYHEEGRLAVMTLSRQDFADCGALSEHTDTLVDYGLNTIGVRMALLSRETETGAVKMSLRAKEPDRVDDIAVRFGGGGHAQASGITMPGPLKAATEQVREAMIQKLRG